MFLKCYMMSMHLHTYTGVVFEVYSIQLFQSFSENQTNHIFSSEQFLSKMIPAMPALIPAASTLEILQK